jgi:hypothetical protein
MFHHVRWLHFFERNQDRQNLRPALDSRNYSRVWTRGKINPNDMRGEKNKKSNPSCKAVRRSPRIRLTRVQNPQKTFIYLFYDRLPSFIHSCSSALLFLVHYLDCPGRRTTRSRRINLDQIYLSKTPGWMDGWMDGFGEHPIGQLSEFLFFFGIENMGTRSPMSKFYFIFYQDTQIQGVLVDTYPLRLWCRGMSFLRATTMAGLRVPKITTNQKDGQRRNLY